MPEIETDSEQINKPFVIRGHHLIKFYLALKSQERGLSPNLIATMSAESLRNIIYKEGDLEYKVDVLGQSYHEEEAFLERFRGVFVDFLTLPNEYPVQIVAGIKDRICNSCFQGNHCFAPSGKETDRRALFDYFGLTIDQDIRRDCVHNMTLGELKYRLLNRIKII